MRQKLYLNIMEVENGYIVSEGHPESRHMNGPTHVAATIDDLKKVIHDLAVKYYLPEKKRELSIPLHRFT